MEKHTEQAMRVANSMLAMNPIYIDTETTGVEDTDVVVELAVLDTDGGMLFESLVKPIKPIPAEASKIHGITDAKVVLSPDWTKVWPEVTEIFKDRVAGFFNAAFDIRMIRQSCGLSGIAWAHPFVDDFCVMELFARYYGEVDPRWGSFRWKNLAFAGRYFQLPEPNSHRAKDDAFLTKLVLEKMAEGFQP